MSQKPYELPEGPRLDEIIDRARLDELIEALDAGVLTRRDVLEIGVVLACVRRTLFARKRRRGAPVSETRLSAQLAIEVAQRSGVKDAAAVIAAAPPATQAEQEAIERTMRKIRSGEIEKPVFFFDEAIDRACARLGPPGKSGKK
jgi:hypothetical protein